MTALGSAQVIPGRQCVAQEDGRSRSSGEAELIDTARVGAAEVILSTVTRECHALDRAANALRHVPTCGDDDTLDAWLDTGVLLLQLYTRVAHDDARLVWQPDAIGLHRVGLEVDGRPAGTVTVEVRGHPEASLSPAPPPAKASAR